MNRRLHKNTPGKSGQAIAELVMTLIVFLIITISTIHFAQLAFTQLDLKAELRLDVASGAMGSASKMLPDAISDWNDGADGFAYTADDRPDPGNARVFSRLHDYAEVDGGALLATSHLDDSPAQLSSGGFSLFQLGLTRRAKSVDVPVDPFLQDLIYPKPTIRLAETRWMPLMGGLL